jgi:hypothetical protein
LLPLFLFIAFAPVPPHQKWAINPGQTLFPLEIELGIPHVRSWKELLATEVQTTWLFVTFFLKQLTLIVSN